MAASQPQDSVQLDQSDDVEKPEANEPAPPTVVVSEQDKLKAEELKNQANKLFQECHYNAAIDFYDQAINLNPTVPSYYSNRALAHTKIENYGYAVADANRALALDKTFVKAYYRRASANMAMLRFGEARKDLRAVVKVAPNDPDANKKLAEVEKIMRQQAFEKAIDSDADKVPASQTIDLDSMIVEDSYDGPRFDGDITLEFVESLLERMKKQKTIHKKFLFKILLSVKKLLVSLPSLVDIPLPPDGKITVCGDTHGQYYDLLNIFKLNGMPSPTNPYLFNGDFVDRGSFSVEVILTMLSFKLLYPDHFHITRGNHETNDMNKVYGFEGEVKAKYSELAFRVFEEVFNSIPLAACIGSKVLVVHGGLFSKDEVSLDDLRAIDRFRQPPGEGLMVEMLWSDPQSLPGRSPSKRGVGIQFGPDVTDRFLRRNKLELLIRSHEVKDEGYVIDHDGKCITVFSAPNYCDQIGNKGAYIILRCPHGKIEKEIKSFTHVPHPAVKPMAYAGAFGSMMGM